MTSTDVMTLDFDDYLGSIRRFTDDELIPAEPEMVASGAVPDEILRRIAELGLFGITLPRQWGGLGWSIEQQVRLIDLVPTVMEVVKIRADRDLPGCGLLDLMASPETTRPPGCGYAVSEIAETGAYPSVAVRSAEKKLIHFENEDDELYDLLADPGERNPISPDSEEQRRLEAIAQQVLVERSLQDREQVELDERQIQELKALGYID